MEVTSNIRAFKSSVRINQFDRINNKRQQKFRIFYEIHLGQTLVRKSFDCLFLPIVDRSDTTMLCVVYLWWILNLISFGVLAVEHWATEHSPFVWSLCPSPMPSSSKLCCKLYSFEFELLANISENDRMWHRMWHGVEWESEMRMNFNVNEWMDIYLSQRYFGASTWMVMLAIDFHLMMIRQCLNYSTIQRCTVTVRHVLVEELCSRPPMHDCACVCMWPRSFIQLMHVLYEIHWFQVGIAHTHQ